MMTAEPPNRYGVPDERDLVKRAKERDASAWASLYDSYYPVVFKYVLARLPSPEDTEDVASQVFLEALRTIDGYASRGKPLLAWFNSIARNLIAQRLRQRVREKRDEGVIDPGSASSGMSDEIIERLDLAKALTAITPDQQDVIVLRFFLVMSIKETSAILGKSENAVAVMQVRAIAALRRHLSAGTLKRLISAGEVSL